MRNLRHDLPNQIHRITSNSTRCMQKSKGVLSHELQHAGQDGIFGNARFYNALGAPTKLQCPTTTAIKTTAFAISKEANRFVISFTIVLAQTRINHSKKYFRFRIGGFIIMTAFSRIRHPENPRQRQQQRRSVYRSPHAGVAAREIASKETLGSSWLWYGRRCRVP